MRWLAAFGTFVGVLLVLVVLAGVAGLEDSSIVAVGGTLLSVAAAVSVFRGMKKEPHPEG
jgi:hypothetical protein